jgi:hypothetical protein
MLSGPVVFCNGPLAMKQGNTIANCLAVNRRGSVQVPRSLEPGSAFLESGFIVVEFDTYTLTLFREHRRTELEGDYVVWSRRYGHPTCLVRGSGFTENSYQMTVDEIERCISRVSPEILKFWSE